MRMTWYSACLLLFLFRTNGKKGHLDENDFPHCYGKFSKVVFWKLLDRSYVQSLFSTIMRHTDNSLLKDTPKFYILRTWTNRRAKSFIKTSVNVTEKSESALGRTLHQNSLFYASNLFYALLLLQNLVFEFNKVLTFFFGGFGFPPQFIYFLAFWLIFDISLIFKFIQCFYAF